MIAFIKGIIASYGADWLVIENSDMGWKVFYPHTDTLSLQKEVLIYTYMHITENDMTLFGFQNAEEQELFLRLISVKGLGPKTALAMLMKCSNHHIVNAIESGDVTLLKTLPGIGAKTASQIVLDLKGKLVQIQNNKKETQESYSQEIMDALEGLKSLGYKQSELNAVAKKMSETPNLDSAKYLRLGLQFLSKQK